MKKQKDSPTSEVYLLDSKLRRLDRPGFFNHSESNQILILIENWTAKLIEMTTLYVQIDLKWLRLLKNG